ncbi:hypothetical protein LR48_Vigan05g075500 [Vigna angularis]|uniref:AAA+ ATPase domain-containing protein n=1 Tax=Phaseolus angularis TaxID=3914 RepID=A0A0L9UKD5_PHAAN|nr:hypothetical protein LR48_Vigan05g075500 [Vigna angularis]
MAQHEVRFKGNVQKLQKWKKALFEASNFSGWTLENGYEFQIIQDIVEEASRKLSHTILHIAEYPVGIETRISEVMPLLQIEPGEDIRVIGIYGLGGIGKTTIARALYNMIAGQFEATSFLADIRESSSQRQGLVQLQESLLFDTVGDKNIKLGSIYKGIPIIKKRLCCKKVLLIIDDVDRLEQLQALAGGRDWFGFGSVIIITTRDKHLLSAHQVDKTYEVKKLNYGEAFELFTWSAFKRKTPDAGYLEVSNHVVLYAEGLPLALKIMGSNLFGKTVEEWKSALGKYEKIPNKEVQNVLRVTYDNLEENEKGIFLDVACFFKGETVEYVEKTLQARGFYPTIGISVLIDRSLVSVDEYNRLRMHDLIQDMGKEIVREVSPLEPGKRSRLWYHEDVLEVLTENKYLDSLTSMDLSSCELLTKLPEIAGVPNLTQLTLDYCTNLEEVHESVGFLEKLVEFRAYGCTKLKVFPNAIRLTSLRSLILNWCSSLQNFPAILGKMDNLITISIEGTGIKELPPSIGNLVGLQELSMTSCLSLKELPHNFDMLQSLTNLDMDGCPQLRNFLTKLANMGESTHTFGNILSLNLENCGLIDEDLPIIFNSFPNLASAVLSRNNFEALPSCIQQCPCLELLHLDNCKKLQEIPAFPPNMQYINAQNCTSLSVESSNLLLNKETFEGWELQAMVPGTVVPEWFDHITKGEYMTFWVREKFPAIIICFVLEVESEMKKIFNCEICFYINGEEIYELEIPRGFSDMVTDHVWLYDLRTHSSINWRSLDLYLMDDWNQVEISCEKISGASNVTVSWCGVHVVKQEANMKDILLTDPDPDLDSVIASGSNTLVFDHPVKAQLQSQVTSFILQTPQNNNSSTIVLPTTVQTSLTVNDADMEAFYAVLDDEISVVSLNNDSTVVSKLTNQRPSEETKKALKSLQAHVTKEFSALLGPNEYSTMNDTLEYLTNLPAEDGISVEIRSLIIQVSRQFTRWSRDYTSENKKIESTTSKLLKADELEKCLEANKTNFKQVMCMENELCNDLAYLEQRKRELEEQIKAVKANISASEAAKNMATQIKRKIFGEAKILKAQRDELREQVPHLRDEQELAKKIQSNIRDEWSKLGEKFNYELRHGKID